MKRRWGIEGEFPNAMLVVGERLYGLLFFYMARPPIRASITWRSFWRRPRIRCQWIGFGPRYPIPR